MAEERNERDREDEQAVWEQLVASFDAEPGTDVSWPAAEELSADDGKRSDGRGDDAEGDEEQDGDGGIVNTTRSIVIATGPHHAPPAPGPRDWEGDDDEDEDHYVPPPPPPLPRLDVTAKFAWIGALGGPMLLLLMVLLQQEVTWWIALLGVGGFLGGIATLVARMQDGEDEDDDPHGGAVV
jgi:hypothetical protein